MIAVSIRKYPYIFWISIFFETKQIEKLNIYKIWSKSQILKILVVFALCPRLAIKPFGNSNFVTLCPHIIRSISYILCQSSSGAQKDKIAYWFFFPSHKLWMSLFCLLSLLYSTYLKIRVFALDIQNKRYN